MIVVKKIQMKKIGDVEMKENKKDKKINVLS